MQFGITGLGWLTATGRGRGTESFSAPEGDIMIPARKDVFKDRDERFGRMDPFSKVGLAAIALAVDDAGLAGYSGQDRITGITASTQRGCLCTDIDFFHTVLADDGKWPSPHLFTYTLPSCVLGEAALRFGLTGPSYILHEQETFSLAGIRSALWELTARDAQIMIAGACDLPLPLDSFPALEKYCPGSPGAAFIVLESSPEPEARVYATIQEKSDLIFVDGEQVDSLLELIVTAQRSGNR